MAVLFGLLLSVVLGFVVVGVCRASRELIMTDEYGRFGLLQAFFVGYMVLIAVMFVCVVVKVWMGIV